MSPTAKLAAVLGVMWAVFVPPYLWFRDIEDEQYRKLSALAAAIRAAADQNTTNETATIPEDYRKYIREVNGQVLLIRELAGAEQSRSAMFTTIAWVSSGFILLLARSSLASPRKNRGQVSETITAPNRGRAIGPGHPGATDEPPAGS